MVWNARNGKPIRVFKNCFESDITCMALDKSHRKLILGSSRGEIKVFDVLSGVWIRPYLESHAEENGEISFIAYANEDQNIITAAWDKTIKIHRDDRNDQLEPKKLVMRGLRKAHSKDISCGDYSHNLGLIATGGRDNKVRIWEYEKMKFIDEITCNSNEVAIVKFLIHSNYCSQQIIQVGFTFGILTEEILVSQKHIALSVGETIIAWILIVLLQL